jgi:hypothetical protein
VKSRRSSKRSQQFQDDLDDPKSAKLKDVHHPAPREWQPRYDFDPENLAHWSFDACPEEELLTCWHYEYLRDCPSVIDRVLEWRKRAEGRSEELLETYGSHPYERIITEWPRLPYLEIGPKIRAFHRRVRYFLGKRLRDFIRLNNNPVAVFPIRDWSASDTEILRECEQWLKSARPKDRVKREVRGNRNPTRLLRSQLKALGAWRLSQVMSQNKVISFAIEHGRPLYKSQPELSKAITRTARYLAWLDQTEVS